MTHKVPGQGKSRGLVGWERKTLGCHRDTEGGQERWGRALTFLQPHSKGGGSSAGEGMRRGVVVAGTAGLCVEKEKRLKCSLASLWLNLGAEEASRHDVGWHHKIKHLRVTFGPF